jgi:hypothetical protein
MSGKHTAKLTVQQILESLKSEVVAGKVHLRISRGLQKADPVVLHTGEAFFGFTLTAHLEAAQMYAAKLYDKTKGAITVASLLKRFESNPGPLKNGTVAISERQSIQPRGELIGWNRRSNRLPRGETSISPT